MSDDASTTRANTRNMRPQSSKRVKSTARRATDQAHEDEPGSNDVVLADLSPEERTMRSPPTANAKTWWSEDDDLLLLIQTNIERPFLALKNKMMAWNDTAAGCMRIDGFGRKSLNGKKASQRFQLLLENHRQFQAKSKFMSGGTQKETEKTVLLDELLALMDDNKAVKEEQHVAEAAGKEKKASATADDTIHAMRLLALHLPRHMRVIPDEPLRRRNEVRRVDQRIRVCHDDHATRDV
ncbi:hypothetical protein H257_13960 [Aphanomyces astaci]|uniref:Myb-like domain-containing protein n=1 Tax=Aphanomyces astaci TaxID=112090 RepID=W4FT09_APHAT|nr:hypothetical protein H257_13960 [Aphanomyces astaci]ETV70587.1 hypothetical protein H257_13960 [Aphanomyces astaci]|eukprot:XP_009839970.1 hypothetical protein H257_13960 [Aphanomyces astaci]